MKRFEPSALMLIKHVTPLACVVVLSSCPRAEGFVWQRPGWAFDVDDVTAHLGALGEAHRVHFSPMSMASKGCQSLIATDEGVVFLDVRSKDWTAIFVFDAETPLGVARHHARYLLKNAITLPEEPCFELAQRIRQVLASVPDANTILLRLALKAGVSLADLEHPESLEPDAVHRVEAALQELRE